MAERDRLLTSALHGRHVAASAEMAELAGWDVPLSYAGIEEEYRQIHTRAGVCDISHLGRIRIRGDGAVDLLDRLCTTHPARQEDQTTVFTLICNDRGGIVDACYLLRLDNYWLITCSATARKALLDHITAQAAEFDVKIDDQTDKTVMVWLAGPAAAGLLEAVLPQRVRDISAGTVITGSMMVARYLAARPSWAGLWSLEVILPNMLAGPGWDFITNATDRAGENAIRPIGLATREVLQIEAGRPTMDRELDETIDPISAGLDFAVDFERDFIGAEALREIRRIGPTKKLVGLVGAGRVAAPRGAAVCRTDGGEIGTVTGGAISSAAGGTIAMAYVAADMAQVGSQLLISPPGSPEMPAEVVQLPLRPGRRNGRP